VASLVQPGRARAPRRPRIEFLRRTGAIVQDWCLAMAATVSSPSGGREPRTRRFRVRETCIVACGAGVSRGRWPSACSGRALR
jgi:hypothetical protein